MIPAISRRSVVLPEPLRPIRPTASPRRDSERDVVQRPDVLGAAPAALDEEILERARLPGVDAKAPRDAIDLISPDAIARSRLALEMERVGEHPVPAGPLAVRWLAYELGEARAGATVHARLRLENAGTAPWHSRGREGVQLSYHWLDPLGNAIVWDGVRAPLPRVVEPGETRSSSRRASSLRDRPAATGSRSTSSRSTASGSRSSARPLSTFRSRCGRESTSAGCASSSTAARIPRPRRRSRCRRSPSFARTPSRRRYLVAGCRAGPGLVAPPARRARRGLRRRSAERSSSKAASAHATSVGASRRGLPEVGAIRASAEPLLFPSLLEGLEPTTHEGLPAYSGSDALFEGRAVVRLRPRSGRPSD